MIRQGAGRADSPAVCRTRGYEGHGTLVRREECGDVLARQRPVLRLFAASAKPWEYNASGGATGIRENLAALARWQSGPHPHVRSTCSRRRRIHPPI